MRPAVTVGRIPILAWSAFLCILFPRQNTLHQNPTAFNTLKKQHRERITLLTITAPEQLNVFVEISAWLPHLQSWPHSPISRLLSKQSKSNAHTMASCFRTWFRRKLKLSGKTQYRKTVYGGLKPQAAALSIQKESLPPPYATLDLLPGSIHQLPRSINGSESIEFLRARNPATRPPSEQCPILRPPQRTTRPITVVKRAAAAAVIGMIRALDEPGPRMVAACIAQAIAVAVSTLRSYAAFIAAVTAAESSDLNLIEIEKDCDDSLLDHWSICQRQKNAINATAITAIAADASITTIGSWPFDIYDTHLPESSL